MSTSEILTIIALIFGPILAVTAQRSIDLLRDKRERKVFIFKTLMATRGNVISPTHVESLNRIELEFSSGKKYQKVLSAWNQYFNTLNTKPSAEFAAIWDNSISNQLADLLFEMGQSLGYKFDKASIQRNIYYPEGHGKIERETASIRQATLKLFTGETKLPVSIEGSKENDEAVATQKYLWELMIQYYTRELAKDPPQPENS